MRFKLVPLITTILVTAGLIACNVTGEQNFDVEPGDSLAIVEEGGAIGTDSVNVPRLVQEIDTTVSPPDTSIVEVPDTLSYYVRAFTTNKEYSWSVEPTLPNNVYRNGEFIDVAVDSDDEGLYTISVDGSEYSGTLQLEVVDTTSTP